jgi:hypothetical protein
MGARGLWHRRCDVALEDEEHAVAGGVALLAVLAAPVAELAGELGVRGVKESAPVLGVLANEDDVRAAVAGRAPPDDQQGLVAQELVEVLVHPSSAVVLHEEPDVAIGRGDVQHRAVDGTEVLVGEIVGEPTAVAQDGRRAVEVLLVAALSGRLVARLVRARPVQQAVAEQLAVAQHPLVRAQVVDDVAVVKDRLTPRRELQSGRELAGLLRRAEPVAREAVRPLIRTTQRLRPEALDEARVKQARHPPADHAQPASGPPQLRDLAGRQKPIARQRDEDLEIARLQRDLGLALALTPPQQLALGESQLGVRVQRSRHATSKRVGCRARSRSCSRALRMRSAASTRSAGSNSSKTCA